MLRAAKCLDPAIASEHDEELAAEILARSFAAAYFHVSSSSNQHPEPRE